MKTRFTFLLAALLLMARGAWAQIPSGIEGEGSEDKPYIIKTTEQWNAIADLVNGGNSFSGEYFQLGDNITVSEKMFGTGESTPFSGIFDGNGKTMTLEFGKADDYISQKCALFYCISNATIKNLIIDGSIYSSATQNSSLAIQAVGNANLIQNCVSRVSINSNRSGYNSDCANGGFVALLGSNSASGGYKVSFEGCAFTGEMVGPSAKNWGGFVAWRLCVYGNYNDVVFKDCLFAPTKVEIATPEGSDSRTFCRTYEGTTYRATYTNCYYTTALQAVDGGRQIYSITAGDGVTMAMFESPGTSYNVSGLNFYDKGLTWGGSSVPYAASGETVSLSLTGSNTNMYISNNCNILFGRENPYRLQMTANDAVITGWDESIPTTIASNEDWVKFSTAVSNGYDYNEETVTLTAENGITVSTVAGDSDHPFKGTFDGNGKTMTLAFGSEGDFNDKTCAPFYRIDNATIKNLVIDGSIYSSAQHNASLAVKTTGNTYIQNCISSVSINSNRSGENNDCSNSGFIGILDNDNTSVSFEGCAFVGEMVGANAINWGGFVGWRTYTNDSKNYVIFTDCFFAPKKINIGTPNGSNSHTFCRSTNNTTEGATYTNSYYQTSLQVADGGKCAHSITAGTGVTMSNAGSVTTYAASDIKAYSTGIEYNDVLYAGNGDNVSLSLSGSNNGYYACNGTLTASGNDYTLTMGDANILILAGELLTTIASVDDWNTFREIISQGYDYNGKTVTLTAENGITVSTVAGDDSHPFRGTFDGGNKTMTLAFGSAEEYTNQRCALFYCIDNATIKNLVIDGSIYSSATQNSSLASNATGNSLIQNCISRVSINSNRSGNGSSGDCANGGFIALLGSYSTSGGNKVTFNGCAFTGEMVGPGARNWGGFVAWRIDVYGNYNSVDFKDCLFAPTKVCIAMPNGSDSRTFCRTAFLGTHYAKYTNCYYTKVLQESEGGKQARSTATLPANIGEVGTDYGFITPYANGLEYNGRYYLAPEVIDMADNGSNSTNLNGKNGYYADVTLSNRTIYRDGNWNTLCLPFDVTLEGSLFEDAEARTLSEAKCNDGTMTLYFGNSVNTLTAGTPYMISWKPDLVISSAEEWEDFASVVNSGLKSYSGMIVALAADIKVTKMVGTITNRFKGTFDGFGHTLTFNATTSSDTYNAPFLAVDGATIKNLHTTGTITTQSMKFCSGLVGHAMGNTTIRNCWSSVNIESSVEGDGTHAGIVAMTHNENTNTKLINCLFDGSITGASTHSCGGLIGWNDCSATLTNCVFRPSDITLASGSNATFSRTRYNEKLVVNNCYYSQNLPGASGQGTAIGDRTNAQLVSDLGDGWQVKDSKVVPVLYNDIVSPVFKEVFITATAPGEITPTGNNGDGSVTFRGTYDNMDFSNGDRSILFLGSANTLYWPQAGASIGACRAYFQLNGIVAGDPSLIRAFNLNFGDDYESAGISNTNSTNFTNSDNAFYTLDGRKLSSRPTKKGVYVVNGRKMVLR